jgi:hypothetical protein
MTRYILFAAGVAVLSGCSSIPKDAFLLTPSPQETRELESRVFPTKDELALLKDSAVILENMGYTANVVNTDVGLLTATKRQSTGGLGSTVVSILSIGMASTDKDQVYKATFTTRPSYNKDNALITRLTLQRMVVDSDGKVTGVETLMDKDAYKIFYERLEASSFTEPSNL